jgi:carboxyl-terminal processing protease
MKKVKNLILLSIVFLALFGSCKKDNITPVTGTEVTPAMARDSLYYIMKEFYFWFDMPEATSMTPTTKDNYKDPYELLEAMRYKTLDRWSFVADYNEFLAEMQGTFVGHGFRIGIDPSKNARIVLIYKNSPLYANGVRRGWIVKKINNSDPVPALLNGTYTDLIGPSQAGITNIFVFQKPDGTEVTISSTKSTFTLNTVHVADVLQLTSGATGHLVFDSFITPSSAELATAFAAFKAAGIKDLILDLRYNTGGYLNIAQTLASYIAGDSRKGSTFAKLQYNNRHLAENYTFPFIATPYSLDLSRVVVITTRSTASASEAVMNGLRPFVNVVSIGDTTNGKPTGMNGWPVAEKYYMWPVTFKMVNSANQGEYFDGISPAKVLPDDITHDFIDKEEVCFKEAIHYIETGSVSTKSTMTFKRYPQFSEKPSWMNNAFIMKK